MGIKTKAFWDAALQRAVRTFIQVILAVWTAGTVITDVNWKFVLLSAGSAAIYSLLTSILAGIPEVKAYNVLEDSLYIEEGEDVEDYSKFEADTAEDEEV